jgi:hypothetical protein
MRKSLLPLVAVLAILAGTPVAAAVLLPPHHRLASAATQLAARRKYIGVVSNDLPAFDRRCRCHPNAAIHYVSMRDPVSMTLVKQVLAERATPILELEPVGIALTGIIAGHEDRWLARYARAVLGLRAPVIMSFAPEANGTWYPWGFRRIPPSVYVRAWRHVVRVFRRAGAGRIRWAWIQNRGFLQGGRLRLLWPGNSFVNLLGIDGYFKNPRDNFSSLFVPTIRAMRGLSGDPVLIAETAGGPTAGKLRVVRQLVAGVFAYHLAGFLWFDIHQSGNSTHQDWRIELSPRALTAYRRAIQRYASPGI